MSRQLYLSNRSLEEIAEQSGVVQFHKEYKASYGHDTKGCLILGRGFNEISLQAMIRKRNFPSIRVQKMVDSLKSSILDEYGNAGQILNLRWNNPGRSLLPFLINKRGKVGEVWRDNPKLQRIQQYGSTLLPGIIMEKYQTMRNTYSPRMTLIMGKTYIGVGFVELQQVMEAQVLGSEADGPVLWCGYDMSIVPVVRAKIILAMLSEDIPVNHILQVWYSSCLSSIATNTLQNICQKLQMTEKCKKQK